MRGGNMTIPEPDARDQVRLICNVFANKMCVCPSPGLAQHLACCPWRALSHWSSRGVG